MVFYWQENSNINALSKNDHLLHRKSDACFRPTVRDFNPDHIILHCGTNDLNSERTASQIAKSIIELALSLKSKNNKISVSLIVPTNDNLSNKASEVNCRLVHMCAERNIPYIDHTNSIQRENHLNESKLHFNRYGTIAFANSISKFLSGYYWWCYDSINFDLLFQENFEKESKSFSQLSRKENHKKVSSPSKTIVLNDPNFESEESFLLDQSTSSTLTHELNLDPYSNIENTRSKNPNRLIVAQLNISSLRYKFDSLVEKLHSNVDIILISETKIDSLFPTYRLDRNSNGWDILLHSEKTDLPHFWILNYLLKTFVLK